MERKAMEDREQPAGLDSPGQASAPVTDDATGGGAEGVFGSPWWESGAGPEEAAEEEPDTYRGTGYIYRGVRYGEPVSEPKSQPAEDPGDDDDPVDLSVLAVMSEDRTAVPPAEGGEAGEPVVGAPWWQAGSRPEEAAEEEPGTVYGEPVSEPKSQPAEDPGDDDDPVDLTVLAVMSEDRTAVPPAEGGEAGEPVVGAPWWQAGSRPEEAAEEEPGTVYGEPVSEPKSQPAEDPGDDDDPVDLSVLAVMSEDRTAVPPAEGEEADEPVIGAPWWQAGSMLEEAAEEEPGAESETEETPLAAHEMFKETGYGEPLPEPETEAPDDGNDPVAMSMPAVMSEDQPAVLPPKGRTRPVWTPRKIRPPNAGSRTGSRPVRQPACPSRRNRCRNVRPPN
jgi:hypothetical protein